MSYKCRYGTYIDITHNKASLSLKKEKYNTVDNVKMYNKLFQLNSMQLTFLTDLVYIYDVTG